LGALVATDARGAAGVAWDGTAVAIVILIVGLLTASVVAVQSSIALLAALLVLRHQDRLLVAPLYGACLLVVGELAQRAFELRGQARIGPGAIWLRLGAVLLLAAVGACAAALAAIAVTIAPSRSIGFTAAGAAAVLAAFALVVVIARQRSPENPGDDEVPGTERPRRL
jgi:hypothetical protein